MAGRRFAAGYTFEVMFPLRDSIPSEKTPLVNVLIIATCVAVFGFELLLGRHLAGFLRANAFVPARLVAPEAFGVTWPFALWTMLLSMFLHGGWLHLGGNMWFLWVFGDNVEDALGHAWYLLFYLACGAAATLAQTLADPGSRVPLVGASGAIAGVLGAYLVWFPWSRVKSLVFLGIFFTFAELPAPLFLVLWFVVQLFSGTLSLAVGAAHGGVAWFAHIGGFVAGASMAVAARHSGVARPPRYPYALAE